MGEKVMEIEIPNFWGLLYIISDLLLLDLRKIIETEIKPYWDLT